MKKILPVIAVAAFATSGAVLAQGQTMSDGTVVQPALILSPPVVLNPEPAVVVAPSSNVVIATATVPATAYVYVQPEAAVLLGNVRGPIKIGGPKYDSQGRKIYAPREIR